MINCFLVIEVHILLPLTHSKLTMQWKGLYPLINRHENDVEYLVKVRGKVRHDGKKIIIKENDKAKVLSYRENLCQCRVPYSTNLTELHAYISLVNQLAEFTLGISQLQQSPFVR